jgi:release factor glutamine methyltransferase
VTYVEAVARARAALVQAGISPATAARDADLLARDAAGCDLATWVIRRAESASIDFPARYNQAIARRLTREPIAYIRGVQEFWGRAFIVTPAVLIPRPETELLIESASAFLRGRPNATLVDVGTGSGNIAVTLAAEHPALQVFAVDISAAALDVARANADRHGVSDRIRFCEGSYLTGAPRPVDLIVTNPPYVAERDGPGLSPEVREHEPAVALYGGDDGWRDIRVILRQASAALAADGQLMMEIGYGQSERLAAEVAATGLLRLEDIREDLQGIPRVGIITHV